MSTFPCFDDVEEGLAPRLTTSTCSAALGDTVDRGSSGGDAHNGALDPHMGLKTSAQDIPGLSTRNDSGSCSHPSHGPPDHPASPPTCGSTELGHGNPLMPSTPAISSPMDTGLQSTQRPRKKPRHLDSYICYSAQPNDPISADTPIQPETSGTRFPLAHYVTCSKSSSSHQTFLAALTKVVEPTFYHEAVRL